MGKRAHNFIDLTGKRFGRLEVMEFAYIRKHISYWLCKCDCGNETTICTGNLKAGKSKSCGCLKKEIASEIRSGAKHSEKSKLKMSESRKGKCTGKDHHYYGKHLSEEHRRKLSEAKKGKYLGKDSPHWKSNLTDEDRIKGRLIHGYKEWVQAVLKQDNYTCQVCGNKKSGNLVAHHLESYNSNPKLRTTLSNGTTVCEKHHKDFHHQYGYGNNTRKQFEKFKKEYK